MLLSAFPLLSLILVSPSLLTAAWPFSQKCPEQRIKLEVEAGKQADFQILASLRPLRLLEAIEAILNCKVTNCKKVI